MSRLPHAHYSRAGLLLLTRGISDPCSLDVSRSRTTQSAADDEARDPRACEGDCINDATGPDGRCDSCRADATVELSAGRLELVTLLARVAALAPATPRKCIDVQGEEVRCAS